MRLGVTFAILLLGGLGLLAQEIPLTREGAYWVHTVTGSVTAPQGRLQVSSRGTIVLRGVSGDRIEYKLTQKVRAQSEDEARQRIGKGSVDTRPIPGWARILVSQVSSPYVLNELEIKAPRNLQAAILDAQFGGAIEAYDFGGSVQAQTPAGEIHADRINGSFSAKTGGGEIHLGTIGGIVQCLTGAGSIYLESAGGAVHCETEGGEISVKEAKGPVTLATQGGNISVERAGSSVEAHSGSGIIEVHEAAGLVVADTRGGSIQVGSARGVKAESAQGTVRVRGASGTMNVATAVGNILAELVDGSRLQESSLAAASGDITVLIPSNLQLSVVATNDTGGTPRIFSDFPEVHAQTLGFSRPPLVARGAINGGGPILHVNAGSGVIYLRKAK